MTTKTSKKKPIFDFRTINTPEAAFKRCGYDIGLLTTVSPLLPVKHRNSIIACLTLAVIFEAINDGWVPDFRNKNEKRYFPWPWVSSSGLAFADSGYRCDTAGASVGSCLCTNTYEKEQFIFETFNDLWKTWLLNFKSE